jgi:hypothetical protein
MANRRDFIKGATATLAVAAVLPASAFAQSEVPIIYGDGIHDDAPGLQALIDGKPYRVAPTVTGAIYRDASGDAHVRGGRYRIDNPIHLRTDKAVHVSGAIVRSYGDGSFHLPTNHRGSVHHCYFRSGKALPECGIDLVA